MHYPCAMCGGNCDIVYVLVIQSPECSGHSKQVTGGVADGIQHLLISATEDSK